MIRPAKHLNLNTCLLSAAAKMLERLQRERLCRYEELKESLTGLGADAEVMFLPTVNFLYLMGRVEYHTQTDSFEYLNDSPNSAS